AMGANLRIGGDAARQALRVDVSTRHADSAFDGQQRQATTAAASWLEQWTPALRHVLALEHQREDNDRPYWGTPVRQPAQGRLAVLPGTERRNYNVADGHYGEDVLWARSILEWSPGGADTL